MSWFRAEWVKLLDRLLERWQHLSTTQLVNMWTILYLFVRSILLGGSLSGHTSTETLAWLCPVHSVFVISRCYFFDSSNQKPSTLAFQAFNNGKMFGQLFFLLIVCVIVPRWFCFDCCCGANWHLQCFVYHIIICVILSMLLLLVRLVVFRSFFSRFYCLPAFGNLEVLL